uniref:Non-structural maintenance of chromosomes element 1 homolog n=1 Tax=Ciona savignyi TaxID=51511 RepID=H2Z292_CIOSA
MSKTEAKRLLTRFLDEQWFYDNEGMISLSPRSFLELEQYLSQCYDSFITVCSMCSNTVFQGQVCLNCSARVHYHCAKTYFKTKKTNLKCLTCHQEFPNTNESNGTVQLSPSTSQLEANVTRKKKRTR